MKSIKLIIRYFISNLQIHCFSDASQLDCGIEKYVSDRKLECCQRKNEKAFSQWDVIKWNRKVVKSNKMYQNPNEMNLPPDRTLSTLFTAIIFGYTYIIYIFL